MSNRSLLRALAKDVRVGFAANPTIVAFRETEVQTARISSCSAKKTTSGIVSCESITRRTTIMRNKVYSEDYYCF